MLPAVAPRVVVLITLVRLAGDLGGPAAHSLRRRGICLFGSLWLLLIRQERESTTDNTDNTDIKRQVVDPREKSRHQDIFAIRVIRFPLTCRISIFDAVKGFTFSKPDPQSRGGQQSKQGLGLEQSKPLLTRRVCPCCASGFPQSL